jgi:hypothetical protein
MNAVYEAYNNALPGKMWEPVIHEGIITTYCNEAVNLICKRLGYFGFDLSRESAPFRAKLANDIIDIMDISPTIWRRLPNSGAAQNIANAGALTIACEKTPDDHGHVCVVIPGAAEYSGTWKTLSPKVMNVGKDIFIGKKASWAFQQPPSYFVWED